MQIDRRTGLMVAAAVALPLIVFGALQLAFAMQAERQQLEQAALASAREANARVDARVLAEQSALDMLARAEVVSVDKWPSARVLAADIAASRPRWRNVALTDAATRMELWRTQNAAGAPRPAEAGVVRFLETGHAFGDVAREPAYCPCVSVHAAIRDADGRARYVLTAELGTDEFQRIVLDLQRDVGTSAIVDRHGNFIARSRDYEARAGTPATAFVRDAIRAAPRGVYRGVTYEGLRNYTAFETSSLTGWSSHFAVPAQRFALLEAGSWGFTLLAGGLALVIGAGAAAVALRELSARRRAENRRIQSQKLELLGQLAGGVAHDFNNLLTVIIGSLRKIEPNAEAQEPVANALQAADRAARLTRQLLSFSRNKPLEMDCVELCSVVAGVEDLLRQSLAGAELVLELPDGECHVRTNAAQLELALINLAVNARDAMPDGGEMRIRAAAPNETEWEVVVSDTGVGMPEEVRERAAEPFFTTKPEGQGTGLGLAQVQSLVAQSGGAFAIESPAQGGVTIRLRFQRCEPA